MNTFIFQKILAWQKAHEFTKLVYQISKHFPEDERFGLTSQFRRAAVSIGANIAEGYKKLSKADKLRFFNISEGSMSECMNYIILAYDLGYITTSEHELLCSTIESAGRLLTAYCKGVIDNNALQSPDI